MITKHILIPFLMAGALLTGCSNNSGGDSDSPTRKIVLSKMDQSALPAVVTRDAQGKSALAVEGTERVKLVVFFSTSCPPCRAEVPHLIDLQNKYGKQLEVIGVLVENAGF